MAGVICTGRSSDFLICILNASEAKKRISELFTHSLHSSVRLQFFYPNRQRVSKDDIKVALSAIADQRLAAALCARRERTAVDASDFSGFAEGAFSQAGVVAPPDSPDLGNFADSDLLSILA